MGIMNNIKSDYNRFTDSEKLIVDYILAMKNDSILNVTAKEFGENTRTSAPTVVRFSKKIGFESFNEFKLTLFMELQSNEKKFPYLSEKSTIIEVINNIGRASINTINETIELIDVEKLAKVIEFMHEADTIYIYGIGSSAMVAQDLYQKLIRINKRAFNVVDSHLQISSSTLMSKNDIAITISYSGETNEIINCAEIAKGLGVKVISITKDGENRLNKLSDISLRIPYAERNLREGALGSRMAQLTLIDIIYIALANKDIENSEKNLIRTRNVIDKYKNNY